MNIRSYFADKTVSARTAVLAVLMALVPAFWGIAIPFSRLAFRGSLYEWNRGIFDWVNIPPEAKIILISGYVFAFAATMAMLLLILLGARKTAYAEVLERRLGRFSLASVVGFVGALAVLGVAGFVLLYTRHVFSAYAAFALGASACAVVGFWVSFRIKAPGSYRPLLAILPLLIGICPLIYALLLTPFRVPNEFLALPEETILASGKRIDNIEFINSRRFEGLVVPDPRLSLKGLEASAIRIGLTADIDPWAIESLEKSAPERFRYDRTNAQLEIHGSLNWEEFQYLSPLAQEADLRRLEAKFAADSMAARRLAGERYDKDELEFLRANRPELERQLVLGRFFYHHVFLFLPAVAGVLDGVLVSASQYGRGLTVFFAEVLKRTPENLRFNSYLALLYLSYPLYLAGILLVAYRLGLWRWSAIFVASATLIGYLASEIETVRLGVGLAPWRHFFDITILYYLFRYIRSQTPADGLMLVAMTGFSVYWSREMGLFLGIAVIFGLTNHAVSSRRSRQWLLVVAGILSVVLGYWLGDPNALTHPDAALLGLNTPSLPAGFISILAGGLLLAGGFWWVRRPENPVQASVHYAEWIFLGTSLAYTAICGIYLLWYPRPHHLAPIMPVIGLAMALAYRHYFDPSKPYSIKIAATTMGLALFMLTLLGALGIFELRKEAGIFRTHVVHNWSFPNGQMTSTGQPELISESIDLIRKHEINSSVNILSPWEVVLLPFAGKYKSGPFLVSFDSLFSDKEVKQLAEHLTSSPDKVLFVDSRISQGQYEWSLDANAYMKNRVYASTLRLAAHASLRRVFEIVKPCYELVEEGRLISAYMRKPAAKWTGEACITGEKQP
ncbi:MAG: hypothetical protein Q7T46_09580 [Polaromonas sp.]|nr:hypothetical protein [Polaromonas sp.]